jgi:predicted nucleic acid-binding protein
VIHLKDAAILAAAVTADVDYLVTWDKQHFDQPGVRGAVRFPVLTPGELLRVLAEGAEQDGV